jgi:hypothetical protein
LKLVTLYSGLTTDGGFRPTVTGEQLVALPTRGEFVVVDVRRNLLREED